MSIQPPDVITAYLTAKNDHDIVTMLSCFATTAIVHDEGKDIAGLERIRDWIETTTKRYMLTVMPKYVVQLGAEITVTADVFGDFPGSPLPFDYRFTLDSRDKIATLSVQLKKE